MNPQELIHAYVDGELTQQEEQRVEASLAADPALQAQVDAYRQIGDAIRSTRLKEPDRERWDDPETPRGATAPRQLGLLLLLGGYLGLAGMGLHEFFTGPEPLWAKILVGAIVAGVGILLTSVARQRMLESRDDRYTRVVR